MGQIQNPILPLKQLIEWLLPVGDVTAETLVPSVCSCR